MRFRVYAVLSRVEQIGEFEVEADSPAQAKFKVEEGYYPKPKRQTEEESTLLTVTEVEELK